MRSVAVGKNSKQLNLTISKHAYAYLEYLGERGTTLGYGATSVGHSLLMNAIDRMIEKEPNPDYWRQGLGEREG